jgi:hypothetical protein
MDNHCETKYYWQLETFLSENGGNSAIWNLPNILDNFANSYGARKETNNKIPKTLNYIWVTDTQNPISIPSNQLEIMLRSVEILNKQHNDELKWKVNLWINHSINEYNNLSDLGISIKNINDFTNIYTDNLYNIAIQNKNFGMASDFLRYAIINEYGGVYSDINFILEKPEALDEAVHRYNFFSGLGNGFFASTPHHPIIEGAIKIAQNNFLKPYMHTEELHKDKFTFTMLSSFMPFLLAKIIFSNRNNNNDIDLNLRDYSLENHTHLNLRDLLLAHYAKTNCLTAGMDITMASDIIPFCPKPNYNLYYLGVDSAETGLSWLD